MLKYGFRNYIEYVIGTSYNEYHFRIIHYLLPESGEIDGWGKELDSKYLKIVL